MSTERNRAASPRSRGVGGSRCCGRPRSGRRIHESRCAHRKTTRRREDGSRPESTGIRTEREALRVDSPGWRRRILDRGERASDSCRRWRGPADKGRRKESEEEHGGRWGAVCSVTIDFRRSPNNPLSIFLTRTLSTFFFCTNPLSFTPESYLQKLQYPAVILTFKTLFLPSKYHIASLSSLLCAHILRRVLPNMQLG